MPMYLPIVIAAVALHTSPVGDNVPKLDIARECQNEVGQAGLKSCMDDENRMREQLKKEWQSFDAADRARCGQEAGIGGATSYAEFLTCLEMARDTRNAQNQDTQNQGMQNKGAPRVRK